MPPTSALLERRPATDQVRLHPLAGGGTAATLDTDLVLLLGQQTDMDASLARRPTQFTELLQHPFAAAYRNTPDVHRQVAASLDVLACEVAAGWMLPGRTFVEDLGRALALHGAATLVGGSQPLAGAIDVLWEHCVSDIAAAVAVGAAHDAADILVTWHVDASLWQRPYPDGAFAPR